MQRARRHVYTPEQKTWLRENAYGRPRIETAEEFIQLFNVDMKPETVIGYMKRNGIKCGIDMRYRPGQVAHNKGVPMTQEQYDAAHPTMFKAGSVPANTDPIGTEKVLADGYVWVKVNDIPKAKKSVNWKQKQRLIYEQHHGPLDPNARVVFMDGDKRNFNIENLKAISRGELALMNNRRLWTESKEVNETCLAAVNLSMLISKREERRQK